MVVVDELVHNSVVMGIRSSRRVGDDGGGEGDGGVSGRDGILRFRHNDVSHLRHILRTNPISLSSSSSISEEGTIIIVVESVCSMDGDVAPLKGVLEGGGRIRSRGGRR